MKTKRRIILVVLCLSLLVGVGTAFASISAGGQLEAWYKAKLDVAELLVFRNVAGRFSKIKTPEFKAYNEKLKNTKVDNIIEATNTEIDRASKSIYDVSGKHIDDLKIKAIEIEKRMPGDFDAIVANTNESMKAPVNKLAIEEQEKVENAMKDQGETSFKDVSFHVGNAKEQAIDDLREAIEGAKKDLEDLITQEIREANKEVIDNLDKQIEDKKQDIKDIADELELLIKDDIEAEGQRIENEAIEEMEKLVGSINK